MKSAPATAITMALAFLLCGCSAAEPEATPTPQATTSAEWHAPAASADDSLAWEDNVEAVTAATTAMTAFIDHSLPAEQWWTAFEVHLTPEAKYAWLGTDPRTIPATEITGAATVSGDPASTRVHLSVPTDAGIYELTLTRRVSEGSAPGPWLIYTLNPPISPDVVGIGVETAPPMSKSLSDSRCRRQDQLQEWA